MTPDVNILVAASRHDHPHHAAALAWLEQALVDAAHGVPFTVQPMVVAGFLRLVTNPRIFVQPTPIKDALDFIDALLGAPGVEQASLGGEWPLLRKLCTDHGLTANDLPDAWLAAAVIHQASHLVSFDGDFKKLLPKSRFTRLSV